MLFLLLFFFIKLSFAYEDPTGGKPFFQWSWHDQIKPMIKEAGESEHLTLLGGMVAGSFAVQPFDRRVRDHRNVHGTLLVGKNEANAISDISHGGLEIGAALMTLGFDTDEGVKLSRALIFTSLSTSLLKFTVRRERPDQSNRSSWPSGHTSSMFALSGSLSASYGLRAAIPAYAASALVAVSRIRENEHWLSDVVGGAFLGTYWAMVSHDVKQTELSFIPVPVHDGGMILVQKSY